MTIKREAKKAKKGPGKKLIKGNKKRELKIKILANKLLDFTLSYLMSAP
jgi:hypothetical protein